MGNAINKIDVVYLVGPSDKSGWHNNELRYSLRSLETMAGEQVGNVYIVGYKPPFVSDKVTFFPANTTCNAKCKEHIFAFFKFFTEFKDQLTTNILRMDDDMFFIKPTDIVHYPYYIKGDLKNYIGMLNPATIDQCDPGNYKYSLASTYKLLYSYGGPTYNYEVHLPIRINPNYFLQLEDVWDLSYCMIYGAQMRSVISNLSADISPTTIADLKFKIPETKSNMLTRLLDRDCFSIGDGALTGIESNNVIKNYLQQQFPNKSKYETN